MSIAFSSMTPKRAAAWLGGETMAQLRATGAVPGLHIIGDWHQRRFVIAALTRAKSSIPEPRPDIEAETLTIPLGIGPEALATACRSFGARVERRQRDLANIFENVGDFAGMTHTVHAYHHISLCGSKGPWTTGLVSSSSCSACARAAATKPKHRARYAPPQPSA